MISDERVVAKWTHIKHSAKTRDIPFGLSLKRVRQLLSTKRDYYTGEPLTAPSFDRVDNAVGYVDSNVVVCNERINFAKANLSVEVIRSLYNGLKKHGNVK